jgi:regulatory protein YycI of two-component signal transduction system YycFG
MKQNFPLAAWDADDYHSMIRSQVPLHSEQAFAPLWNLELKYEVSTDRFSQCA